MPGITKLIGIYDADGGIFGEINILLEKFSQTSIAHFAISPTENQKMNGLRVRKGYP